MSEVVRLTLTQAFHDFMTLYNNQDELIGNAANFLNYIGDNNFRASTNTGSLNRNEESRAATTLIKYLESGELPNDRRAQRILSRIESVKNIEGYDYTAANFSADLAKGRYPSTDLAIGGK